MTDKFKQQADERLFQRMQRALENFLQEEAPLYSLVQVGVINDPSKDEIVVKLHLQQAGSARRVSGPMLTDNHDQHQHERQK